MPHPLLERGDLGVDARLLLAVVLQVGRGAIDLGMRVQHDVQDDEDEGDTTEEGEDAEEQQGRILQVLVFTERFNFRDESQFMVIFCEPD